MQEVIDTTIPRKWCPLLKSVCGSSCEWFDNAAYRCCIAIISRDISRLSQAAKENNKQLKVLEKAIRSAGR